MEGLWNVYRPQLLNGKYSFPDDNFMLWRKKKKTNFTVSSRKEIIREMKVGKGWNLIESERKDVDDGGLLAFFWVDGGGLQSYT